MAHTLPFVSESHHRPRQRSRQCRRNPTETPRPGHHHHHPRSSRAQRPQTAGTGRRPPPRWVQRTPTQQGLAVPLCAAWHEGGDTEVLLPSAPLTESCPSSSGARPSQCGHRAGRRRRRPQTRRRPCCTPGTVRRAGPRCRPRGCWSCMVVRGALGGGRWSACTGCCADRG